MNAEAALLLLRNTIRRKHFSLSTAAVISNQGSVISNQVSGEVGAG
jgi:hypothetical protein